MVEYKNKREKKQTKKIIKKDEYQKQPPEVFYVLKNFGKFTKTPVSEPLF